MTFADGIGIVDHMNIEKGHRLTETECSALYATLEAAFRYLAILRALGLEDREVS